MLLRRGRGRRRLRAARLRLGPAPGAADRGGGWCAVHRLRRRAARRRAAAPSRPTRRCTPTCSPAFRPARRAGPEPARRDRRAGRRAARRPAGGTSRAAPPRSAARSGDPRDGRDARDLLAGQREHRLGLRAARRRWTGAPARRASDRACGSTRSKLCGLRLAVEHDEGDEVGDGELGLQAVGDVVVGRGTRARPGGRRPRSAPPRRPAARARSDAASHGAVAHQAARPRLDPVLLDRGRAVRLARRCRRPPRSPPERADHVGRDRRAGGRDAGRVHAGRRRQADLERLAVGPERGAQPAGLQQRQALGGAGALVVEPEQPRRRVRRARRAADRGRMPAAVVERGARGVSAPIASKPAA